MKAVSMSTDQMEFLTQVASHIDAIVRLLDCYEPSRPSSMVFTKLEEAMMWFNNLLATGKLVEKQFPATTQ